MSEDLITLMQTLMHQLAPSLPSHVLQLAMKDFEEVSLDDDYEINMSLFHKPNGGYNNTCSVCLAGSVMAKSLGVPIGFSASPGMFDEATAEKLEALDLLRTGDVCIALTHMGYAPEEYGINTSFHFKVDDYHPYRHQEFVDRMGELVKFLQEKGL